MRVKTKQGKCPLYTPLPRMQLWLAKPRKFSNHV